MVYAAQGFELLARTNCMANRENNILVLLSALLCTIEGYVEEDHCLVRSCLSKVDCIWMIIRNHQIFSVFCLFVCLSENMFENWPKELTLARCDPTVKMRVRSHSAKA